MISESPVFDFFAIGETVIDLITEQMIDSLASAKKLHIFVGGQSTNLAINLALLGRQTALAACLGEDGLGEMAYQRLDAAGVNLDYIQYTNAAPTTISIIARHKTTADFTIHRGADTFLEFDTRIYDGINKSRIVHSSAFSIARQPARSTILRALGVAHDLGCLVTFDPNYHPRIEPDTVEFESELITAFQYVDITKPSLDDCIRLFGPGLSLLEYAENFMEWGPSVVLITMGAEGVFLATSSGDQFQVYPDPVNVSDITGAGDAFWSGYLLAWLEGASPLEAACFGQVVAGVKVKVMGPITQMPVYTKLRERAGQIKYRKL